jgi:hypothetical protein
MMMVVLRILLVQSAVHNEWQYTNAKAFWQVIFFDLIHHYGAASLSWELVVRLL